MKLYALCTLHEVRLFFSSSHLYSLTHAFYRLVGVHVLVSVMLPPPPQLLKDRIMKRLSTTIILISNKTNRLLLVIMPSRPLRISHHHHTTMNQCQQRPLPCIPLGTQGIGVSIVGGKTRMTILVWRCKKCHTVRDERRE